MSAIGKNGLRMPFAEWLYRMAEADVPYQARGLAVYAVLFKVSANDELAKLAGMDTKGLADKTYNKWKKLLADDGWVILKAVTIGRTTSIEVFPSFKTSPVTFTDVSPRDPARVGQNKSYGRDVTITGESYGRDVTITDETEKVTAEEKTSPAPAHAEDNNNIYNNIYNNNKHLPVIKTSLSEQEAAREPGDTPLIQHLENGLIVNCESITHPKFSISLTGIHQQLFGTVPMAEVKDIALGHARQWALDAAAGRPNAFPTGVGAAANVIRASIKAQQARDARADMPKGKTAQIDKPKENEIDKINRMVSAASERQSTNRRLL